MTNTNLPEDPNGPIGPLNSRDLINSRDLSQESFVRPVEPDSSAEICPAVSESVGEPVINLDLSALRFDPNTARSVNNTHVLDEDEVLSIAAGAAVLDFDETMVLGTAEHVHDGPSGRFALALMQSLNDKGFYDFELNQWNDLFRSFTGRAQIDVCRGICNKAKELYGVSLDPEHLSSLSDRHIDLSFLTFMQSCVVDDAVKVLMKTAVSSGLSVAVCSSSSEEFVGRAIEHFGLRVFVRHLRGGAPKKEDTDLYNGNPVKECCSAMGITPEKVVMFGDSVADYASAALAGVNVVVLRIAASEEDEFQEAVTRVRRQIQNAEKNHPGLRNTELYFTRNFSQVRIELGSECDWKVFTNH